MWPSLSGYDKYANKQVEYANTEFGKLQQQILADKKIKNVVLLGSSPYDENVKLEGVETLHGKNETIKRIIEMQAEVAQKRGWGFVNFNTVMCELNKEIQQSDSTATYHIRAYYIRHIRNHSFRRNKPDKLAF